jgi:hypothetical protein
MPIRWLGAPVLDSHPPGETDARAFYEKVVGTIIHCWSTDTEIWAVARLWGDTLPAKLIESDPNVVFDTSPSVLFAPDEIRTITDPVTGETITIEPRPILIDHLAIITTTGDTPVPGGVWTRSDDPTDAGVPTVDTQIEEFNEPQPHMIEEASDA